MRSLLETAGTNGQVHAIRSACLAALSAARHFPTNFGPPMRPTWPLVPLTRNSRAVRRSHQFPVGDDVIVLGDRVIL